MVTDSTHKAMPRTAGGACLLLYLIAGAALLTPRTIVADKPTICVN